MGKVVRTLKKASFDLTSQVTRELDIHETDSQEKPRLPQPGQNSGTKPKKG